MSALCKGMGPTGFLCGHTRPCPYHGTCAKYAPQRPRPRYEVRVRIAGHQHNGMWATDDYEMASEEYERAVLKLTVTRVELVKDGVVTRSATAATGEEKARMIRGGGTARAV